MIKTHFLSKYCSCISKSFQTTSINDDFRYKILVFIDIYGTELSKINIFNSRTKKYWLKYIFIAMSFYLFIAILCAKNCVTRALGPIHTRYFCTQYSFKKAFWYLIILRHRFLLTNQSKLLKTPTYLGLSFVKSLPWLVIKNHDSKLSIYF